MVTMLQSSSVRDGKGKAGFAWAIKATTYLNELVPGHHIQTLRSVGGHLWQIHWMADFSSLAEYETVMKQIETDAGYQQLLDESRVQEIFISSSTVNHLYQSIG